ncbi:hypothetical protein [Arthrobacter psychrolactophilus]
MTKEQTMKTASHKKWLDELTLELRLNDASGKSIGDALATVEEFLADSGQSPEEAFGTAREYAAELAAEHPTSNTSGLGLTIATSTFSLVVFLIFSAALTPWSTGDQLLVGAPQLACFALTAAAILCLPLYLASLLRHRWALLAVPLIGGTLGVFSAILTPDDASEALLVFSPAPVLLITAGLLILVSAVGTVFVLLSPDNDTISRPLDIPKASSAAKARWFELLTQWLFPIIAVVLMGITALFQSML